MWPVESLQGNWYKHTYSFICSATLQSIESIEQKCGLYSLYIMSVLYIYLHTPTYTYPHIYLPMHTPTHTYPCTYLPIHFKYLPTHFTHTYPPYTLPQILTQTPTHTHTPTHTTTHTNSLVTISPLPMNYQGMIKRVACACTDLVPKNQSKVVN